MPHLSRQNLSRAWMLCFLVMAGLGPVLRAMAETPKGRVLHELAYKSGDEQTAYEQERCKLDLYLPPEGKAFPTLVWFHGGGLTGGRKDSAQTGAVARSLA
ncbi:MAG TPA: hypothetical protein VD994_14310, partial [Prosthecobacter sp.]|nr:hypothetical protein [Prosthecobacter sp.]